MNCTNSATKVGQPPLIQLYYYISLQNKMGNEFFIHFTMLHCSWWSCIAQSDSTYGKLAISPWSIPGYLKLKLFSLSFLWSLFFCFFEMQFLALLHLTSNISFQTNPGLSFPPNLIHKRNDFTVRGLRFSSLYSFHSFHLSETKEKKSKLEENHTPKNCR